MTIAACPLCGTHTNPGAACTRCGTPVPADTSESSGYAQYWEGILDKLRRVARPKYDVRGLLGYGGMAGVFLADEPRLGRRVALKVLSPALMADQKLVERFVQEARTIALLNHPNIVTVYEVDDREDLHWFTMSYVGGRTLGQVLSEAVEPLPIDVVRAWLFQIADALSYAHQNGVVHRDIKPGNVLIDLRGNALVTDFGIAKLADVEAGLTRTGMLVGTPTYMSPEQCTSGDVAGASDQYSFGAVLYQMLTAEPLFAGPTLSVLQAHVADEPTPIGELRPDCPPELADAVHRMLAKRPEDRWDTMSDLIEAAGASPPGVADPIRGRLALLAAQAASITVSGWRERVSEGTATPVEVIVRDVSGTDLPGRRLTWLSSAPVVAAVSAEGQLLAYCPGGARLTVTCGAASATLPLTVAADPVADIEVRPATASIAAGDDLLLGATVYDLDGSILDDRVVLWSSSDPQVARVLPTGRVRGIGPGEAAIVAGTGGRTAAVKLAVAGTAPAVARGSGGSARTAGTPVSSGAFRASPAARRSGTTPTAGASQRSDTAPTSGASQTSDTDPLTSGAARRSAPPAATAERTSDSLPQPDPPMTQRRRNMFIIAAATITLAVAGVGAMALLRSGAATAPGATDAPAPPSVTTTDAPVEDRSALAEDVADAAPSASDTAAPARADAPAEPQQEGTVGIAGDLPDGTVITVRDATGRERPVAGRSISLAPGTYIMEARAPGHDMDTRTFVLQGGMVETWTPRLRAAAAQPAPDPVSAAPQEPSPAPARPVTDTRADQAAIDAAVRAFVAAFDARSTAAVVPLLPDHRRAVYTRMLDDERNVTAFGVTLAGIQPAHVEGDVATIAFDIVVSFRNYNQANRIPHGFTGRAERAGTGWRLVSLADR